MVFANPFHANREIFFHEKAYSVLSTMGEGSSTSKIKSTKLFSPSLVIHDILL